MSTGPENNNGGSGLRYGLAGLIAGLAILTLAFGASGATLGGVVSVLGRLPWPAYVAIGAAQLALVWLASVKWRMVLTETQVEGRTMPLGAAIAATGHGALLGQVISIQVSVPIVRAWLARRHGISARAAAGTSLFEQSLELVTLGVAAVASVAIAGSGGQLWVAGVIVVAMVAGVLKAIRPTLRAGARAIDTLPLPGAASSAAQVLSDGLRQAADQRPAVLRKLMGLSLVRYVIITALNVGIMLALIPGLDPFPLIVAYPLILLVTSLPFLPGGLGAAEVTWVSALVFRGVGAAEAAEAALALRIVSLAGFALVYPGMVLFGQRDRG